MLADIGTVDKIPDFIKRVKDKNSEVRLMGFGHRVYKNYDPRAKIMHKVCHAVLAAVARTVGWISQWSEMIEDPHQKIGRPRQLYTGVTRRDYVDIAKRK